MIKFIKNLIDKLKSKSHDRKLKKIRIISIKDNGYKLDSFEVIKIMKKIINRNKKRTLYILSVDISNFHNDKYMCDFLSSISEMIRSTGVDNFLIIPSNTEIYNIRRSKVMSFDRKIKRVIDRKTKELFKVLTKPDDQCNSCENCEKDCYLKCSELYNRNRIKNYKLMNEIADITGDEKFRVSEDELKENP